MQFAPVHSIPADGDHPQITDQEAEALARATLRLFQAWGVSDREAQTLLGGMAARTWARWKEGRVGRIDRDLRMRMAHLMGIHKGVRTLFKEPARGYAWVKKPNQAFDGLSALQVMLRGEMSDLSQMRTWLNAERGAW